LLLLSSAVSAGPIERLTLAASPVSSFAPANLVVRVHVTPDPANRALEVTAESSDYFRSSRMQLDGEDAQKTITLEFRGLPHGDYAVWGRLIDSAGHERASARRQVVVLASAGGGP
jgi:hypothetical protein